ncbi:MAG: hypothetical protein V3S47_06850 [Acidobacteriota bacterium]
MANVRQTPDPKKKRQKGALMAGVVAMLAISLIWSAVAFQAWIDVLRRDNEAEMIFRAQEIVRAIQRYRRDHGGQGPLKLKDLLEPSPRRSYYLRREYDDPLVRDGKWGLLHMGPGGVIIDPHALAEDGGLGLLGGGPTAGSRRGRLDRALGQGQTPGQGQILAGSVPANAGLLGGLGNPNDDGGNGLPIAGLKSLCTDKPFRVYRGETEYAKWLFTYLDLQVPGLAGKGKAKGKGGLRLRGKGKGKGSI